MAASNSELSAGDIQDLAVAAEQLTEETRLLRSSLDELRDDVVWAARQVLSAGYFVTGTPPPEPHDPLSQSPSPRSGAFSLPQNEATESGPYCCDQPKLSWNGDPDSPGVACESCGYVIAENGSVVIWCDESDDPPLRSQQDESHHDPQGKLF